MVEYSAYTHRMGTPSTPAHELALSLRIAYMALHRATDAALADQAHHQRRDEGLRDRRDLEERALRQGAQLEHPFRVLKP